MSPPQLQGPWGGLCALLRQLTKWIEWGTQWGGEGGGHEATETGLAYAPVSQAHGHNHIVQGKGGGGNT